MFDLLSGGTYFIDTFSEIAKWIAVGAISVAVITAIIVYFLKRSVFTVFLRRTLFLLTTVAILLGITLLVADIAKHYDAAYLEDNYVSREIIGLVLLPSVITLFTAFAAAVTLHAVFRKSPKSLKLLTKIFSVVIALCLLTTLVLVAIYYARNISGDGYYTADGANFNQAALYASALLLAGSALFAAYLSDTNKFTFTASTIARAGVCLALSFALSYVRLFKLPQGGSVTLASALPIMLFAFSEGPKKGLFVGFVYGLMQSIQDPFIIHPAQFLLDYPIAYAMLGFAGVLAKTKMPVQLKFALGAVVAATFRFAAHVISGVFAFGAYADGQNVLAYSLAYNSFVFVDIAIAIVAGVLVLSSPSIRRLIGAYMATDQAESQPESQSEDQTETQA